MDITTKTNSGLEQKIHLFETPLREDEVEARFERPEDEAKLLEEHREKYADAIFLPDWQEVALVLDASNPVIDPRNLEVLATTTYHVQAYRRGIVNDISPISVVGLTLTSDNKLVYGIRGGEVKSGFGSIVPGESVSIHHEGENLIIATYYGGLIEELGIGNDEIKDVKLLGYMTDPEFTKGINFVFYGKTKHRSSELKEIHRNAYSVYQDALVLGATELDAREEIKKAGLPNVDAWEHRELAFVDNNPNSIKKIIDSRKIELEGNNYPLLDTGRGSLIMYNEFNKALSQMP